MKDIKTNLYKCFYLLSENFFADFIKEIDKRIVFQKYGLFFATIFGLEYGSYGLYIHGPYNSSLADIGYEFAKDYNNEKVYEKNALAKVIFSEKTDKIINFLKETLTINDINFLEVFSTYFYLMNYKNFNEEEIMQRTKLIKKEIIQKTNIDINDVRKKYKEIKNFVNKLVDSEILI